MANTMNDKDMDNGRLSSDESDFVRINDTGSTLEQINEHLKNNSYVDIIYGDFGVQVESNLVKEAREVVKALSPEDRQAVLASIHCELKRNIATLRTGKVVKAICDHTMHDLVLWHVLTGN
jgi:hypothetical protein